jgi:ABC-type transport system involved in multi-copper enzyme maturation permease subunit
MNAKSTRILKEARTLLWPWCAVIIAGVLPLVQPSQWIPWPSWAPGPSSAEPIGFIGFFLGIPLLAVLSLGNEFQHRTLSLLLTQPVDRMEIWGEKLSVTVVAVLSAALVFFFGWRSALQLDPQASAFLGACIIATIASATFWTLVARSTLGGIVLNWMVGYFVCLFAWLYLPDRIRETGDFSSPAARSVVSIATIFLLCYAGAMLWLGRRKLVRFQVTGGMAGDDLLMAGPSVMPEALAGWFRCRPTGAVLNLIRKELRLLRPLWLITLLAVLYLTGLTAFRLLPGQSGHGPERQSLAPSVIALMAPVLSLLGLIVILAGSLSLGEERTSGTHSWHMTLPVSARRQWLTKLLMALFAAPVCAVLLPALVLIAGGSIFGSPFMFVDVKAMPGLLLVVLLLSFASFWCASAVNGTVRAALWLLPLMATLLLAGKFGAWVAPQLMDLVVSRFDLFADFRLTNAVSNIQLESIAADPRRLAMLLLAPALLLAVRQSYRLFRTQLQDSALPVIRRLLPLAMVTFLWTFALGAFDSAADHARYQIWGMFRETHAAIEKLQSGTAQLEADHPLRLTAEDLAKASPLSERTRRWLANSIITVVPDKPHPGRPYCCGGNSRGITLVTDKAQSWYLATIQLQSGSSCTVSFMAVFGHGTLGGVCK